MNTSEVKSGELHAIVHIGCNSMVEIKELCDHALKYEELLGGIAVMSPSYFKPKKEEEVAKFLIEVANFAPKMNICNYHIPMMNGIEINVCDTL